eukprot:CAMPEP_0197063544 /NCGR_PEP_ID=MMETSP1384-20130603/153149_1 /TAXON_ID=29189 /ORGANISM="Ammonia sp." /LENGTH=42 /DNA_ID= /DNA_START= /DNA_END= /DNA_ORIENTATION=
MGDFRQMQPDPDAERKNRCSTINEEEEAGVKQISPENKPQSV